MSPFISQIPGSPKTCKQDAVKEKHEEKGTERGTSDRTIAWGISHRSPEEVTFEHIVIGVLAPVMLEVDRHAESEVDSHTVASPMAQRGYG